MDAGGAAGFGPEPVPTPIEEGATRVDVAPQHVERPRWVQRGLLTAAIACFGLPFLTVTCYGDTTVSGVQAATKIDLYPSDGSGERELMRNEPPNGFAFIALLEAIVAAVFSFRSRRVTAVWAAATGVIALQGLFVYAFHRSWGESWPRIGFVGAMMLLLGGAWLGAKTRPRWIVPTIAVTAVAMIPGAIASLETLSDLPWLYMPIYGGGIVALALSVGAYRAAVRESVVAARPTKMRTALAGTVALTILTVAAIVTPYLMAQALPDDGPPEVVAAYGFAIVVLAILIGASLLAWAAARAVVRRAQPSDAPNRRSVGTATP